MGQYEDMRLSLFNAAAPELTWYVVNDNVMGGRSEGDFQLADGVLEFSGVTNTRGGGLSSIRTQPSELGLSSQQQIVLCAHGDGRCYVFRLEDNRGIAFWADFVPTADSLGEVTIDLASFRPRFRGRWLDGPALVPDRVVALGLMCYDGSDGPFRLKVGSIEAR